jgi:hypothetical protein
MALSAAAAYGMYATESPIQEILASLNQAGCSSEDVCLLMPSSHPVAQAVRDAKFVPTTFSSDAPASELLQWLSRLGAVVIPGVAFFVGSRVFLRAVLDPCPVSMSSSSERLLALGLSPDEADHYGNRLNRDGVMIFVSCRGEEQSHEIREVLSRTGALEASCSQEPVPTYVPVPQAAFQMSA